MSAGTTRPRMSISRLKWRRLSRQTGTATVGKNSWPVARDSSRWLHDSSVTHANEIQSFGGRGETGRADFAGAQSRSDFFDAHFAERTFHQCAHHQPNHLVEEAVAVELDRDARTFLRTRTELIVRIVLGSGFPRLAAKAAKS